MANDENQKPAIMIRSQYIKDMSLEVPFAPEIFKELSTQPQINVDMGMTSDAKDDGSHIVTLNTKINADINGKKLFILELAYCANVELNVQEEQIEPVLLIEMPRMMFPFVRSIVAGSLTYAGLPPLMLAPIDFAAMYQAKKAQAAAENNAEKN